MTDREGLLDTGVLLSLPRLRQAGNLPTVPLISALTLAEIAVGPLVAMDGAERARRQAQVQQVEATFDPLPFDAAAARAYARVAASLRRAGRKPSARTLDAMIAAVAIARGLPLYTTNPHDFDGIDDLIVREVPPPGV